MRFTNALRRLQQVRRLTKVLKNWNILNRQWSQSVVRTHISLRFGLKDPQDGLIFILIFFYRKYSTLEPDLYKKLFEKDIESLDMELYKKFLVNV